MQECKIILAIYLFPSIIKNVSFSLTSLFYTSSIQTYPETGFCMFACLGCISIVFITDKIDA